MGELPGVKGATIVDQGNFSELMARGQDLSNILQEQKRPREVADVGRSDELCSFHPLGSGHKKIEARFVKALVVTVRIDDQYTTLVVIILRIKTTALAISIRG